MTPPLNMPLDHQHRAVPAAPQALAPNGQPFVRATPDALAAAGVEITHIDIAGDEIYSKRTVVQPGASVLKHTHPFDHASALVRGCVCLEVDGIAREVRGPAWVFIEAGKEHCITALTEVVWHCMHIPGQLDPSVDETVLKG